MCAHPLRRHEYSATKFADKNVGASLPTPPFRALGSGGSRVSVCGRCGGRCGRIALLTLLTPLAGAEQRRPAQLLNGYVIVCRLALVHRRGWRIRGIVEKAREARRTARAASARIRRHGAVRLGSIHIALVIVVAILELVTVGIVRIVIVTVARRHCILTRLGVVAALCARFATGRYILVAREAVNQQTDDSADERKQVPVGDGARERRAAHDERRRGHDIGDGKSQRRRHIPDFENTET